MPGHGIFSLLHKLSPVCLRSKQQKICLLLLFGSRVGDYEGNVEDGLEEGDSKSLEICVIDIVVA